MIVAERGPELTRDASQTGVSLLFAGGKRPSVDEVARLLASPDMAGAAAFVSFRPPEDEQGWMELLVNGLTFELTGLRPGKAMPLPQRRHSFGLPEASEISDCEAITLVPGRHVAGGFAMIPVVQAMTGLAAHIALPLGAQAVCWHPAKSWMEPQYFSRVTMNWLAGGAFPALGLTALQANANGAVVSEGLSYFAGQEVIVEGRKGEEAADVARLAVRFVDFIATNGPFKGDLEFEGPGGELLRAEVSGYGKLVTVRRNV